MGRERFTYDYVVNRIKNTSPTVKILSTEYVNSNVKLECACLNDGCTHTWFSRIHDLFRGHGCSKCGYRVVGEKNRIGVDEVNKIISDKPKVPKGSFFKSVNDNFTTQSPQLYFCSNCCGDDEFIQMRPSRLLNNQRSGCCVNKVITSKNNVAVTSPELLVYFKNKNDAFNISSVSRSRVDLVCDKCGFEKTSNMYNLSWNGFYCDNCSDKIPMTEKFVLSMLNTLGIEFRREVIFDWLQGRKYDFYIPSLNLVIEVHGEQHYKEKPNTFFKPLSKQQEIDKIKKDACLSNDLLFVDLDFRKSEFDWMQKEVIVKLDGLIDLSNLDWDNVLKNIQTPLILKAISTNGDISKIKELSKEIGVSIKTIRKWIRDFKEVTR
jgi:hypothetical protein